MAKKTTTKKPVAKKPKPPIPSPPITPKPVQSCGVSCNRWCHLRCLVAHVFNHALALAAYVIVGFVAVRVLLDDYASYNPVGNALLALLCAAILWLASNIKLWQLSKSCGGTF